MIRRVKLKDIKDLAPIYKDLYDDADIGEFWSVETSERLLKYWYDKQKDLFFVYEENDTPLGAIVSGVKSWFDGFRLVDTEIFVSKNYDSLYDSVRYASEKEKLFVFNHYKYDCGGCKAEIDYEWWKNNLISNKEITKYKDYDCSRETNTDHIDVCERVKTYLKQKVKIRYIKTEYFKLLKIILILFYLPFIIACIIKWIVSGFKQSNSNKKGKK